MMFFWVFGVIRGLEKLYPIAGNGEFGVRLRIVTVRDARIKLPNRSLSGKPMLWGEEEIYFLISSFLRSPLFIGGTLCFVLFPSLWGGRKLFFPSGLNFFDFYRTGWIGLEVFSRIEHSERGIDNEVGMPN